MGASTEPRDNTNTQSDAGCVSSRPSRLFEKTQPAVEVQINAIASADATAAAAMPPVDQAGPRPATFGRNQIGGHIDLPLPTLLTYPASCRWGTARPRFVPSRATLRTHQEYNTNMLKSACATQETDQ